MTDLDRLNAELTKLRAINEELQDMKAQSDLLAARALACVTEVTRLANEAQSEIDTEAFMERLKGKA